MKKQPHDESDLGFTLDYDFTSYEVTPENDAFSYETTILAHMIDSLLPLAVLEDYLHHHSPELLRASMGFHLGKLAFLTATHPILVPSEQNIEQADKSLYLEYFRSLYGKEIDGDKLIAMHEPFNVNKESFTQWIAHMRALVLIMSCHIDRAKFHILQQAFFSAIALRAAEINLPIPARHLILLDANERQRLEYAINFKNSTGPISMVRETRKKFSKPLKLINFRSSNIDMKEYYFLHGILHECDPKQLLASILGA